MTINPQSVATDLSVRIAPDRVHRVGSLPFDEGTRLWNGAITNRPERQRRLHLVTPGI
jgi:hypothetical protein